MQQRKRRPLYVEPLEDRWVPATVRLLSGSLIVSNPAITQGTSSLTLTATADNTFQVMDGNATLGTYSVAGNIYVFGNNATNSILVDLHGFNYSGNVFVSDGNGNDDVGVGNLTGASTLGGNVTILEGVGPFSSVEVDTSGSLTVGGSVQAVSQQTQGQADFEVGSFGPVTIGGDVTATNFETAQYGSATIGGNFTVNDQLDSTGVDAGTASPMARSVLGKNLTVNIGNGNFSFVGASGIIGGNQAVNLGNGSSLTEQIATVSGNLSVQGAGNDAVVFDVPFPTATVQGNTQISLGDGANLVQDLGGGQFQGNFNVQMGNGNNSLATFGSPVGGNMNVQLGNGTNASFIGDSIGGQLLYHSGNGNDSLTLGDGVTPNNYNVNAVFGNGDDSFTLDTPGLLTGSVNGGGRITGNMFNQQLGTLSPYFMLSNFP